MKPVSHPSKKVFSRHDYGAGQRPQAFPKTDYYFQATAEAVESPHAGQRRLALADLRAFRKISSEFMAVETHREYATEAALFALVGALAAWPVISMLILLAQTAPG